MTVNNVNSGDFKLKLPTNVLKTEQAKEQQKADESIFSTGAQKINLNIESQSEEKCAGELLGNDSKFIPANAKDGKSILEKNGVNLKGFEQKENSEGQSFFEKQNEDGSVEWVRVVTMTDDNGETYNKILHSYREEGSDNMNGKIYEVKENLGLFERLKNWQAAHSDAATNFEEKFGEYETELAEAKTDEDIAAIIEKEKEAADLFDKQTNVIGKEFNFMQNVNAEGMDSEAYTEAYKKQTEVLANGEITNLDSTKDGAVDFDEFQAGELKDSGLEKFTDEESAFIKQVFDAIDTDKDGKIGTKEYQGFYAALDNVDKNVDGKINIGAVEVPEDENDRGFMSKTFKENIKQFQDEYLK